MRGLPTPELLVVNGSTAVNQFHVTESIPGKCRFLASTEFVIRERLAPEDASNLCEPSDASSICATRNHPGLGGHSGTQCHSGRVLSVVGQRLGPAAADSIPERRPWADLPVLCRRRLPETAERDLIGAWQLASIEACPLAGRPQR